MFIVNSFSLLGTLLGRGGSIIIIRLKTSESGIRNGELLVYIICTRHCNTCNQGRTQQFLKGALL